jgi:hypothetical protein
MKKILLALCATIIGFSAYAQEWFPTGAKWTYNVIWPSAYPTVQEIKTVYCKGDTLIDGINAKILVGGQTMCALVWGNQNYLYYNVEQDIVYLYWENEFKPYYDFSKKAGESYFSYYHRYHSDPAINEYIFTVDSVVVREIGGIPLRQQFFSISDPLSGFYLGQGNAIESIVSFRSFYPEDGACDFEVSSGLRCYESPNLNYYAKPEYALYGCDYGVGINENLQKSVIQIFPNPVRDIVTIQIEENMVQFPVSFFLIDVLGNKITEGEIVNSYTSINFSNLPKGIHFLKLNHRELNGKVYKLVKI